MIVGKATTGEYVTYVQGNPDSPINKGALCSKGSASAQFSTVEDASGARVPNPGRLTTVKHRAANDTVWTTMTMDAAMTAIAAKVFDARKLVADGGTFVETESGRTVNRCTGIASLGAAAFNNEACYMITKLMRSLGVVYLEHQARV